MAAPKPHRSTKAPKSKPWDWGEMPARFENEILDHRGWRAMANAHAWYEGSGGELPERKGAYKLPHHQVIDSRLKVVFEGVKTAMNVLASTRFGGRVTVRLPPDEVRAVYEHLAEHFRQFGERPPRILKGWTKKDGWPSPDEDSS